MMIKKSFMMHPSMPLRKKSILSSFLKGKRLRLHPNPLKSGIIKIFLFILKGRFWKHSCGLRKRLGCTSSLVTVRGR
jgi:hypothetical protein